MFDYKISIKSGMILRQIHDFKLITIRNNKSELVYTFKQNNTEIGRAHV